MSASPTVIWSEPAAPKIMRGDDQREYPQHPRTQPVADFEPTDMPEHASPSSNPRMRVKNTSSRSGAPGANPSPGVRRARTCICGRPPDQAVRNHAATLLVAGQVRLGDGALPHAPAQPRDGVVRSALKQHSAFVDDGHVGAQVGDVLNDVGGKNHDHLFADFGEQVVEAVALARDRGRR